MALLAFAEPLSLLLKRPPHHRLLLTRSKSCYFISNPFLQFSNILPSTHPTTTYYTSTPCAHFALPVNDLIGKVTRLGVDSEIAEKVIRGAETACQEWKIFHSDFLKPPEWEGLLKVLNNLVDIHVVSWGGYTQAERRIMVVKRKDMNIDQRNDDKISDNDDDKDAKDLVKPYLTALYIKGNFLFETNISHRDFLGTLMSIGIKREKMGDIIVLGDRGAQIIITKEMTNVIQTSITQVKNVNVQIEEIQFNELDIKEPLKKELTTVESSMRLDAVSSAGFGMSRNKLSNLIKNGNVKVNYREVTCPGKTLRTSDLVTLRGKGRLKIGQVSTTAKGKYRINISRFV